MQNRSLFRVAGMWALIGCVSLLNGMAPEHAGAAHKKGWVKVASFSDETNTKTDTFTVPKGTSCRVSWTTKRKMLGGAPYPGLFIVWLKRSSDNSMEDLVVNTANTKSGSTNVYKDGTFYFDVSATQPWTLTVYEKK